jgi:hypothetical protein
MLLRENMEKIFIPLTLLQPHRSYRQPSHFKPGEIKIVALPSFLISTPLPPPNPLKL